MTKNLRRALVGFVLTASLVSITITGLDDSDGYVTSANDRTWCC